MGPFTYTNSINNQASHVSTSLLYRRAVPDTCRYASRMTESPSKRGPSSVIWFPFSGLAKRIFKILRTESWREKRFLRDYLRVPCLLNHTTPTGLRWHHEHLQFVNQVTEFLWQRVRVGLTKKSPAPAESLDRLMPLGGTQVRMHASRNLEKGPKYSIQSSRKPTVG